MYFNEDDYLAHYGVQRRSGRYKWGSGGNTNVTPPRNMVFLDQVDWLKGKGLSESMIAQGFGMTVNKLRASKSIEVNARRQSQIGMAQRLQDKGLSKSAIGRQMNVGESTVRSWLAPGAADRSDKLHTTANMLKSQVAKKELLDIGKGVENHIGVTRTSLDTSIEILKQEGYEVHTVNAPQVTTGHDTKMKVLVPPGTTQNYVFKNRDKIQQITDFSDDNGKSFGTLHEPLLLDPKRVSVVYREQGGDKADGMIYVRPGIDDISIGGAKYSQVRVGVGNDHYLKGMAIYKEDLPKGTDVQFHTSKSDTGNKFDAMKANKDDPGFVEGGPHVLLKSVRRQLVAEPGTPKEHVTSTMNLVNEEGDWRDWSRNLSSQMLSKQSPILAKSQLDMTYENRQNEFDALSNLTNATVRKRLLSDFADSTDSAAVHLKAAALPRTVNHVILPVPTMSSNQIYAPSYRNGEKVVLIRHPHGGTFEIPELTVNNKHRDAKQIFGNEPKDAVGINHEVAKWLSGADFDGDTVLVIPNNPGRIRHSHALDELKSFDPRRSYPPYDGMKRLTNTQNEMGEISNLLTDMSIKGAPHADIARAVKHSMVIIDAEKHNLDYKRSFNDNGIRDLKKQYQVGGASTLISRAGSPQFIPDRKPRRSKEGGPVNLKTGAKEFEPTNKISFRTGKPRLMRIDKLAATEDARTLMSSLMGTRMERLYANHSNKLKTLANRARLVSVKTPTPKQSKSAKHTYKPQIDSLNEKLDLAQRNAPLERAAQLIAHQNVKARKDANPNMEDETKKKISYQALVQARIRTGAQKQQIKISPDEWDAIQAGAISNSKLVEILNNADMETVRKLATPKTQVLMTSTKTDRAKLMLASGYTRSDVAEHLGVSLSTLDTATQGE